ncbi:MAG: DUF2163 domain-containing protein [Alphaproteobacteria bacterium]|nr:DUF2163 domain-containing protein [Alphaproteobacteria bacterium]
MKTVPTALQAHLDTGATTLALCWKLTLRNGTVQGFTNHDCDLVVGGVTYKAASAVEASEIQSALGLAVANMNAIGALSDAGVTEALLAAGAYDGAEVELRLVNWADTSQSLVLMAGAIGEVRRNKTAFSAELRSLAHRLNQKTGRIFSYDCDADLGDARCGINLALSTYSASGTIASVAESRRLVTVSGLSGYASDWFTHGKLTWTSGDNDGWAFEVKGHAKTGSTVTLELWQRTAEEIAIGDGFTITAGCDKQFATCGAKFSNEANFRGFPHMPGNDAVQSYPSAGDNLDGGSLFN